MATSLDIIIVNWNSGDQLKVCISSIGGAKQDGFILRDVIIVDNASTDASLNGIDCLGVPVTVIRNSENRGFAAACNQGAAMAESDYLLLLNPDAYLFEDSLVLPIAFMERTENTKRGICGVQLIDDSGEECLSYARFPDLWSFVVQATGLNMVHAMTENGKVKNKSDDSGVLVVDQVIGAFFVVRKVVFDQLKGFDERFFVYFEEVDFSLRALNNGWTSVCLTGVRCGHVGGLSSRQVKASRLFYSLRSRILYSFKHFSLFSAITLLIMTLMPEFFSRLIFTFVRSAWSDFGHTVHGYSMLIRSLPATLRIAVQMRKSCK